MVFVFLAEGFELVEAMAPVDILRRAGIETRLVGVNGIEVAASNGVTVKAELTAEEVNAGDITAMVLPGGLPGTLGLEESGKVQELLDCCAREGKLIGAICAAPSILAHKGLLKGREATVFPNFRKDLEDGGAVLSESYVCKDGQFVTARGMGVSTQFGLKLCEVLASPQKAQEIRKAIQTEGVDKA